MLLVNNIWNLGLYYRDHWALDDKGNIIDFAISDDTSISFKYKKI